MRTFKTWIACAGLLAVGLASLGCHTVEGFGEDMQHGGSRLSDEAREHSYR